MSAKPYTDLNLYEANIYDYGYKDLYRDRKHIKLRIGKKKQTIFVEKTGRPELWIYKRNNAQYHHLGGAFWRCVDHNPAKDRNCQLFIHPTAHRTHERTEMKCTLSGEGIKSAVNH